MPNFKPKAKKKIKMNNKSILTLDNQHSDKMKEFHNLENKIIPNLKTRKKELKKKLQITMKIEDKLNIQDEIREIKKKVKELEQKKKTYLLNNSKYIFPYFEKKKELSQGKQKSKNTILHNFFKKDKNIEIKMEETESDKFLININENLLNIKNYIIDYETCKCGGEFIHIDYKGMVVCNKCAIQKQFLIEHEKPSYKEPPKEVCFYAYKRINHFREILAQFQAKETTQIPDDVFKNIKSQIKKERISLKQMTNKKAKDILKKLGYNKYYEHIPLLKTN